MHLSIRTGEVPTQWGHGAVIPIPKPNKDLKACESYRPVTLTSVICKLTERVVETRLVAKLALNGAQLGYRHTRSTTDAVFSIVDAVLRGFNTYENVGRKGNRNKKCYRSQRAGAILFDFTKAFDLVDLILMKKLSAKSKDAPVNRWIRNFLTDRTFTVALNDVHSKKKSLRCGVPQGTILGPLLWLIYVDDLLEELSDACKALVRAYAGDLTVVDGDRSAMAANQPVLPKKAVGRQP